MDIFNQLYYELGSTDLNLVLNTSGKVKIRYGKKYFDLLDKDGNLNIPNLIKNVKSKENIKSNGFYVVNDNLYLYINGKKFRLLTELEQNKQ